MYRWDNLLCYACHLFFLKIQSLKYSDSSEKSSLWLDPPPIGPYPHIFFDFDKILVFSFQIILLCNTICNICYECLTMGFIMFLFFFFRKIQYKINSPSAFYIFVCKKKCTNVSMCLCTFNVKCVNSIILTAILDVTVPD